MTWWQQVFANVGVTAAAITVLAFLARSIVKHWLDKDIERFKSALVSENQQQSEKLRHELQRAAIEHNVRFSDLHSRRVEAILNIHQAFLTARLSLADLVSPVKYVPSGEEVDYASLSNKAVRDYNDLNSVIQSSRIFFDKNTSGRIDAVREYIRELVSKADIAIRIARDTGKNPEIEPAFREAYLGLIEKSTSLEDELAASFRHLLGVEVLHVEDPKKNGPPGAS